MPTQSQSSQCSTPGTPTPSQTPVSLGGASSFTSNHEYPNSFGYAWPPADTNMPLYGDDGTQPGRPTMPYPTQLGQPQTTTWGMSQQLPPDVISQIATKFRLDNKQRTNLFQFNMVSLSLYASMASSMSYFPYTPSSATHTKCSRSMLTCKRAPRVTPSQLVNSRRSFIAPRISSNLSASGGS